MISRFPAKYALFLPALLYLLLIILFSRNMPLGDDYPAVIDFFTKLENGEDASFFSQFYGHFIAVYRYIHYIFQITSGSLNFRGVVIFWNAAFTVSFFIFLRKWISKQSLFALFPSVFILFSLQYFITSIWAVLFLSNVTLALWSIACIIDKKLWVNYMGITLAVLAVFNGGNGIALPVIAIFLLFSSQKSIKLKIAGSTIALTSILVFFSLFTFGEIQSQETNLISNFEWSNIWTMFLFINVLLSSVFFDFRSELLIWLCSAISIASYAHLFSLVKHKYYKTSPFIFAMLLFTLITSLAVTYGRSNLGILMGGVNRYKIFSALYVTLILISVFDSYKLHKRYLIMASSVFMLFWGWSVYSKLPFLHKFADKIDFGTYLFSQNLNSRHLSHPDNRGGILLKRATDAEVFTLPKVEGKYSSKPQKTIALPKYESRELPIEVLHTSSNDSLYYIEVSAKMKNNATILSDNVYFHLRSDNSSLLFRSKFHDHIFFYPSAEPDFYYAYALFNKTGVKKGQYDLNLVIENEYSTKYKNLGMLNIQ